MGVTLSQCVFGAPGSSVLLVPDGAVPCRAHLEGRKCKRRNCTYAHGPTSLTALLSVIKEATSSLDICVFNITCNEIAAEIQGAADRGVRVRIVTDREQADSQGSDIESLSRSRRINVRKDLSDQSHMHHKFAIINGRTLINGSFNWTRSAVLANKENIVVTRNDPSLLEGFVHEFERLWVEFG